jgi:uncharacterized membrane protein YfbV (UPF0208 family)
MTQQGPQVNYFSILRLFDAMTQQRPQLCHRIKGITNTSILCKHYTFLYKFIINGILYKCPWPCTTILTMVFHDTIMCPIGPQVNYFSILRLFDAMTQQGPQVNYFSILRLFDAMTQQGPQVNYFSILRLLNGILYKCPWPCTTILTMVFHDTIMCPICCSIHYKTNILFYLFNENLYIFKALNETKNILTLSRLSDPMY